MATKNKPLVTNTLAQNVFVRDTRPAFDRKSKEAHRVYFELQETETDDGISLKLEAVDYPITPDYVQSFVDSTNYKRDPAGAVASAPRRQNLGDITEMQRAKEMDSAAIREVYKKICDLALKQAAAKAEPKAEPKKEGDK